MILKILKPIFPWKLKVAENLNILQPPTQEEMDAIELMDPSRSYLEDNIMNRPVAKILMSGNIDINAYRAITELNISKFKKSNGPAALILKSSATLSLVGTMLL